MRTATGKNAGSITTRGRLCLEGLNYNLTSDRWPEVEKCLQHKLVNKLALHQKFCSNGHRKGHISQALAKGGLQRKRQASPADG